jgi:hypothetical protein
MTQVKKRLADSLPEMVLWGALLRSRCCLQQLSLFDLLMVEKYKQSLAGYRNLWKRMV